MFTESNMQQEATRDLKPPIVNGKGDKTLKMEELL